MLKFPLHFLALGAAWLTASVQAAEYKIVAYVPNWIDLPTFAAQIDFSKLTHVNIAFENPTNDEGALSFHPKDQALIDRAHAAKVPVLVSIGGGSASENEEIKARYFALIAPTKRAAFVAKLVGYVREHQLDGVDVDLEGPSINEDYGPFIHELAAALQADGKLLTAALSKGYGGAKVPASVFADFAFVNIMAYDATGLWNPNKPGPHSSVEFAMANAQYWLDRGLPREKAVLGVPFYGVGFGEAWRKRQYPYREIVTTWPGAENADQTGQTVYYNGLPAIKAKAAYVTAQHLGGMMIWSLDSDAPGERSLLSAMDESLGRR